VIPTASEDADAGPATLDEFVEPWRKQGVISVKLLHTRSRATADEPDFCRSIDDATGVWFSGGDQSRITEAYRETKVEQALRRMLRRGGVIGGTSAGAAIMSKVMITGGGEKATVGTGLGFLPGAVVDQHALKRSRVNRLLGGLDDHPELIGIAIDESTALVVQPDGWRVVGKSYVVFCRSASPGNKVRLDFFQSGDRGVFGEWKSPPSNARGDR
jgi:cyanophycinase